MKQANISIETARAMYEQGGAGKAFALDNFSEQELTTPTYRKTWEECYFSGRKYYVTTDSFIGDFTTPTPSAKHKNCVNTKEQAEAILALTQLLVCRDAYRGEWKPNYSKPLQRKFSIELCENFWKPSTRTCFHEIFVFEKEEQRDAFLENFKDLLEQVKPLFL